MVITDHIYCLKDQPFTDHICDAMLVYLSVIGIIEWLLHHRDAMWMGFLTRTVLENATR